MRKSSLVALALTNALALILIGVIAVLHFARRGASWAWGRAQDVAAQTFESEAVAGAHRDVGVQIAVRGQLDDIPTLTQVCMPTPRIGAQSWQCGATARARAATTRRRGTGVAQPSVTRAVERDAPTEGESMIQPAHAVLGGVVVVAFAIPLFASGCGAIAKVDLWRLITSGRDGYQRPEMVIDALDVRNGSTIAEIGAGEGYWLPWLSEAVGTEGKVYAVEVEADDVERLRRLVDDEGFGNVEVVFGRYEDPLLPDGSMDLVITSKTYHHIEERVAYFRRLQADLAPHGRVAHLDDRPDLPFPLSWITAGHTSDPALIERQMTEAGYVRLAEFDFIYPQSFLVYGPVAASAGAKD